MRDPELSRAVQIVAITIFLVAAALALYWMRFILLIAAIGIGLGVLFAPIVTQLNRRFRIPRGLSGLALVLLILLAAAGSAYGFGVFAAEQFRALSTDWPTIFATLQSLWDDLVTNVPGLREQAREINLAQISGRLVQVALGGLGTGVGAVAGAIVILTLAIYTAVRSEAYLRSLLSAFPARLRPRAGEILHCSARTLRDWFTGQLIVMGVVAVLTGVGLWIIGVEYWIVFGLIAGVLDLIPYVGPILAAVITLLVVLGTQPDQFLWVVGLFLVIQQIEGNALLPLVMRDRVKLPEVHLLLVMLVLGSAFGLLGVLVAPPLLAVARTIYLMTYVPRMNSLQPAEAQPPPGERKSA